ncbi:MAG: AraC family transcriptional regulator [Christensenella sp.]|nr:AraC family transcriptional regulator [Christensenella sp.]
METHWSENPKYYYEVVSRSKQFPIMVYFHARSGINYCAKHWHRSLELCCYMNSPVTVWNNGKTIEYPPDSLILFNYGDVHELIPRNLDNPLGVSLIFPYEFLIDYSIKPEEIRFLDSAGAHWDAELKRHMHSIVSISLSEQDDPFYYLRVNSEIFELLHLLMTNFRCQNAVAQESLRHLDRCKQILAYIDNNFSGQVTLESLANELGLSVGYLARYFSKYLGTTFKQHLTSVRLQRALIEVLRDDKTMLDIAIECGFPDYRSFVSAFRKWYRYTPYQYRMLQQERRAKQMIDHTRPELVFNQHITNSPVAEGL